MLRVGYSYWGFLGDYKYEGGKEVSTPDGNATYSWSILHELQERGHKTFLMQKDRDHEGWVMHGHNLFGSFSREKRMNAYLGSMATEGAAFPELDVLLLEWRFPIPGRNCLVSGPEWNRRYTFDVSGLQPDLQRQQALIDHYRWNTDTKVIVWDLDHKFEDSDEASVIPHAIFETSARPRYLELPRTRVEPPTVVADLLQHETLEVDPNRKSVYIGSRYERDDVITEWLKPLSDAHPLQVEFWGNWMKSIDECLQLWPNVSYHDRVTTRDFRRIYGTAASVPLLAKRSYLETGFITPRPWEALLFGSIPVGLRGHLGVERYVDPGLMAGDGRDMVEVAEILAGLPQTERHRIREENAHQLSFMDARHFVDRIEEVADGCTELAEDQIISEE